MLKYHLAPLLGARWKVCLAELLSLVCDSFQKGLIFPPGALVIYLIPPFTGDRPYQSFPVYNLSSRNGGIQGRPYGA